ncbi:hypothetical protein [Peterkaempfera griseoplana]|uniref:hypothetical protein n=1 Tax=Peterkaempfera griseoplana TaxID=66896 RepID=UPI000B104CC5|nr:hypothetical protein [Peterkaempfera griseoplana]
MPGCCGTPPFFDRLAVRGHRPQLALLVEIAEVFCPKALLRSGLWRPDTGAPGAVPSRARICKALERPDADLAELEAHYGSGYADHLYG